MGRTLFQTKTGKGIILAMIGVIGPVVVNPIFNIIDRHISDPNLRADVEDVRNIAKGLIALVGVGGGGLGLVGRAVADGPVISPSFFPGPSNEEELNEENLRINRKHDQLVSSGNAF